MPRHSDGHGVVYGGVEGMDVELDDGASQLESKNLHTKGIRK